MMKILTIQLLCHRLFLALCLSIGVRLCAFPSVCVYRVSGDNPPLLLYYTLHNIMWQMQIQIHLCKYKYKCCQIQIFADANSKLMCAQKRCLVTTVGSCSIYYILLVQNTLEVKIQIQVNIATGETSQAITPFHFFDNLNISNFHHQITFITR